MDDELSKDLLDVLACPVCKSDLNYNKKQNVLICKKCRVNYPINEGIPVLLPDTV